MPPRKESTVAELSEGRSLQSAETFFQKAQKRRQMDLSQFSKDEQKKLYDWYEKNSGTLSHDDRMQFLEQCITNRIIDDTQLLSHIEPLKNTLNEPENDDAYKNAKLSLRTIGEYLAFIKNPAYLQSLWACWDEIPYQIEHDLKNYCTREHPELAILVTPFMDMSKLYIFTSKTGEKKVVYKSRIIDGRSRYTEKKKDEQEKKFIEAHIENFEDAKPYIENILAYCEKHKKEIYSDTPIIENLRAINKLFLFPYLAQIENLGIYFSKEQKWQEKKEGEKEKTGIQNFLKKENIPYYKPEIFFTRKEREELTRLRKEFIKHNPKMAERLASDESGLLAVQEALPPEHSRRSLMTIIDTGRIRATQTLLGTFKNYKHHLSETEQQEFLLECIEKSYPIFTIISELNTSKETIADLFKKAAREKFGFPLNDLYTNIDIQTLLTFNTSHHGEPDIEKLITTSIEKNLSSSEQTYGIEWLIRYNTNTIFSKFSPENQKKIIQAIDTNLPSLWMNNIPFALEHSKTPFHTILNSIDGYDFLKNYTHILYHTQRLEKDGVQTGVTVQNIHKNAHALVFSNPWAFFVYPQIVKENFTDTEQKEYIESHLSPPVQSVFFLQLLESSLKDTYKEQCKKIIEKDQALFDICMQSHSGRERIKEFFGQKKMLAYAMEKIGIDSNIVKDTLFHHEDIYCEFLQSQKNITEFLKKVQETGSHDLTILLLEKINFLLSNIEYYKKIKSKVMLRISESRLKELKALFLEATREACDEDPFLIFDKKIRSISELNPKERMSSHMDEYFTEYPEELLERGYRDNKFTYEELLGEDTFLRLVSGHARILAFSDKLTSKKISFLKTATQEQLITINPSLRLLSKERLDTDFYEAILSEIRHSTFFQLYEKRLREIGDKEYEVYGKQDVQENITIPDEFSELVKRITLLENNECARTNAKFFLQLPEKKRDRILNMLEFLSTNNLDTAIPFDSKTELIDTLQSHIQSRIHEFFEQTFDIKLTDSALQKLDTLSVEGLGALIIYYKKICNKNSRMKIVLQECVSHVIDGTYKLWKLPNIDILQKLQEEKLLPKKLSREQYEIWKKEDTLNFEDVIQYDIASIHFGIREVLEQAVIDRHIEEGLLLEPMHELQKRYSMIAEPLKELVYKQKEQQEYFKANKGTITNEQQEEYNALKQNISDYTRENKIELARIKALQYLNGLKKISTHDLEEKILTIEEKKRIPFSEILKTVHIAFQEDFPYFVSDVTRIQSILSEGRQNIFSDNRVSKTKLFITDRVDFETYIRIGEKPVSSCQHYDSGSYNRGLLSYLIDPNLKIIQVYDVNEKIIARAILRLVNTREGNPSLFAERIYSANSHPKIYEAIANYVEKKSQAMGIPYALSEKSPVSEQLFQTGSRSPFVYTDAGGGLMPNGIFQIEPAMATPFKFKGPEEVDKM